MGREREKVPSAKVVSTFDIVRMFGPNPQYSKGYTDMPDPAAKNLQGVMSQKPGNASVAKARKRYSNL